MNRECAISKQTWNSLWAILLFLVSMVEAQVAIGIAMPQNQLVAGEAALVKCTITNQTGSNLLLSNSGQLPWLEVNVTRSGGQPATQSQRPNPAPVQIPAGQAVAKTIDLNSLYNIREAGTYRVSVFVRTGDNENAYSSNSILFHTITLRPDWSSKFSIAGTKDTREFRMMNFTSNKQTMIYVQVIDSKTGNSLQTLNLGKALLFRKPQAAIDKQQIMHVLYLATPEFFLYARIDNKGRYLGRDLYTPGAGGDPSLMTFADGSVKVASGIKFDADAALKQKSKIRKLSDRPRYTYN
jgi:hypothetical protein